MEITNKIKLKVASQYYGCPFLVCYNIEGNPVIETFSYEHIELYEPNFESKRELLILKSNKNNSFEFSQEDYESFKKIESMTGELLKDVVGKDDFIGKMMLSAYLSYQYAISKGIDFPQYFLNGKTLREAGLAIYEDEVELFSKLK